MSQFLRDNQAITAHKRPSGRLDTFLSVRSQAEIGDARVAAIKGPFSLAVADNEAARCHVGIETLEDARQDKMAPEKGTSTFLSSGLAM